MFPEWRLLLVRLFALGSMRGSRLTGTGTGSGVARQLEDCERLAERRGWQVVERYVDDDVSAWSGKQRPEYERMLDDSRARDDRRVAGLCTSTGCTGSRRELEAFIELCERAAVDERRLGERRDRP